MRKENKKTRRKKLLPVLIAILILTSGLLVGGCLSNDSEPQYVKGEIAVYFKTNVTKENATEIIYSFNCSADSWRDRSPSTKERVDWLAIVNVPEGEEKKYVRMFENHTAVHSANLCWLDA